MRIRLWPIYIALYLIVIIAPVLAADTYMGFVNSNDMNTLMVFDPNTNAMVTSFSTGTLPRDVAVGGSYVYVANSADSSVTVYNTPNYERVATITLPTPAYHLYINDLQTRLYVSDYSTHIYVIDTATRSVVGTITEGAGSATGSIYVYNNKLYFSDATHNVVSVYNANTLTFIGDIAVGASPIDLAGCSITGYLYVANIVGNSISKINMAADTVTSTINVGVSPFGVAVRKDGSKVYVSNIGSNNVSIITTASDTVTASVVVGSQPRGVALSATEDNVYVSNFNSNNISIINTNTSTLTGSINCSYTAPERIKIGKINQEISNAQPMQVTFTVTSGVLRVTDVNVSVYDSTTGIFISSDNTDDAGNSIFWLIPGKRYNVSVIGADVVSSSQSVQVQPNRDQYTINVETTGWNWNPGDWFNTNGTSNTGSPDQWRSITSGYNHTMIGTTGYIDVRYNDTSGQTTSILFQLYYRNTGTNTYDLIDSATVTANNASHNFSIANCGNNTYRFYANGTSTLFGNVSRVGEYTFYNYNKVDLGWPSTFYTYFDILVFLLIGYMSTKRKSVMIAGATFELFISWIFLIVGWMSGFGLLVPILITVFAIILFVYAIAKWRTTEGY